jgi:hypothetical protein
LGMLEAHPPSWKPTTTVTQRKHKTTQNNWNNTQKHTVPKKNTNTTQIKDKLDSTNLYIDYTKMAHGSPQLLQQP